MGLQIVNWAVDETIVLPYVDETLPTASWNPIKDRFEASLDLMAYLIGNKDATAMLRVDGDSMQDLGIMDGDLLLVDRAAEPANTLLVVVASHGEYTIKQLSREPDCMWLDARKSKRWH